MKITLSEYISFSRKEGIAAIIMAAIIVPLAMMPFFSQKANEIASSGNEKFIQEAQTLSQQVEEPYFSDTRKPRKKYANYSSQEPAFSNARLFKFDPNTASAEELRRLGLRDKTIQILSNYRSKGGKFRKADDLQKIYGLRPEEFSRLKPFIIIQVADVQPSFQYVKSETKSYETPRKEFKRKLVVIDVNTADTTSFQSLYGIGSKLASRIVNFRNKLGGFYSVDQIGETYGVPDSTFQKIKSYLKLSEGGIRRMNINTVAYDELNAHPYVSSKLAYLIMKFRKENGNFSNLESLKDLVSQTNDSYEKVVNYLSF